MADNNNKQPKQQKPKFEKIEESWDDYNRFNPKIDPPFGPPANYPEDEKDIEPPKTWVKPEDRKNEEEK